MSILAAPSTVMYGIPVHEVQTSTDTTIPQTFHDIPMSLSGLFFVVATNLAKKKKRDVTTTRICRALLMAGPAVLMSIVFQCFLLFELFVVSTEHRNTILESNISTPTSSTSLFSQTKVSMVTLQVICITLFYSDWISNYVDLCRSTMVAFATSYRIEGSPTQTYRISFACWRRLWMYLIIGLPVLMVWVALGIAGSFFLLYSPDSMTLLLDTLAINFILQIDEFLFQTIIPEKVRGQIAMQKVAWKNSCCTRPKCGDSYFVFYHLPFVFASAIFMTMFGSPYANKMIPSLLQISCVAVFMVICFMAWVYCCCQKRCHSRSSVVPV